MLFKQQFSDASDSSIDRKSNNHVNWMRVLIVVTVVAVCGYLTRPKMICGPGDRFITSAVSDGRVIGLGLNAFKERYGVYPEASTIEQVKNDTETSLRLGTKTSNDYFRQLIAVKILEDGRLFRLKNARAFLPKGKGVSPRLEAGECDFSYILGVSPKDTKRPIAVTRLIPGTKRFDPKVFKKATAIILFADASVKIAPINKDGDVFLNGKKLFDTTNPIWEGRPPVIAWPE